MKKLVVIFLTVSMIFVLASCDIHISFLDDIFNANQDGEQKPEPEPELEFESGLKFELREDGYYVVGLGDCKLGDLVENGELVIPSKCKDTRVVGIADGAFDDVIKYDYKHESSEDGHFTVRLEEGIRSIGKYAFAGCTGLRFVTLPSTLTEIGEQAFSGSPIRSIDIPDNVSSLGEKAFYDCSVLATVELSSSLSYLSASVFENCVSLVSVNNTEKLSKIGNNAFKNCSMLENFELGDNLKTIEDGAFSDCQSLTSVILPNSLTSLGEDAFSSCWGVKELHIGRGINEIPEGAFKYMTSLEKLVIPDNITAIHREAFDGLANLKELTISKSVTYFECCFNNTGNIEKIYYEGTLKDWLNINFDSLGSSPLYYSFSAKLYLDGVLLEGDLVIPDEITVIHNHAFERYQYITSVSFPHDMEYIGREAFYECQGLERVSFAGDVDEIGTQVFYGCRNIATIDLGNKLSKTGDGMFSDCGDIEKLVIPSSVKVIDLQSFSSCNFGELVLSEGIEEIRWGAFAYGSISEVRLPSTIKTINGVAFGYVDEVYYNGTTEQWELIDVSLLWCERYDEYYIHCVDGDVYVPPYSS